VDVEGERCPNPAWRPFVATVSKAAFKKGQRPDKADYMLSNGAIKESLAILNSFYGYLQLEEYTYINPVALLRQKSKFIQRRQGPAKVRRLSPAQWQAVLTTAEVMASQEPARHERTLFMICTLYSLYLRISELAASARWTPTMNDFHQDHEGLWWFTTVGKGNKERQIAVSDAMLKALRRWRKHLGLSALPSPGDNSPLIPKLRGRGATTNVTHIRSIVQACFDRTIQNMNHDGKTEDAEALMDATVHWLRHTGISDDVKIRPREHVRDDAGHSSSAITDKYIDIELKERHKSAKRKQMGTI
jgi:integrase